MMPRWTPACLIFLLLAIGAVWSFRKAGGDEAKAVAMPVTQVAETGTRGGLGGSKTTILKTAASEVVPGVKTAIGIKPVATMGTGGAALLAEEIALRALVGAEELSLTEREWAALATVTLNMQAVRHAYEAEIAVATVMADGNGRLEIPEYVEAGAALRTEFYGELLKALGEASAGEVVKKLSERLESRFAGFGAAVQTLDVSLREGSVTRTVAYWDDADAVGKTRIRRETIFPMMEDSDGLQWGALLKRVEVAHAGKKARG